MAVAAAKLSPTGTVSLRLEGKELSFGTRIPALDKLRGMAILLVLIYHLVYQLQAFPGIWRMTATVAALTWSGVDLFFVLSGFLIGGILLDTESSPRYYSTFYARRSFRILPLYLLLLSLCLLRYLPDHWFGQGLGKFSAVPFPWVAYIVLMQNWWMAHAGNLGLGTLSPTWSLAVEEQFYLVIPVLVRKMKPFALFSFLVVSVVAAPVLRALLLNYYQHGAVASYVLMPCRADALSLGVLAAMLRRHPQWEVVSNRRSHLKLGALVFLSAIGLLTYFQSRLSGTLQSLQYSVLCSFYVVCLLIAVSHSNQRKPNSLFGRALIRLGQISYFVYLFHIPVVEVCRRFASRCLHLPPSPLVALSIYVAGAELTILLALVSWAYLEAPLLRQGKVFRY